MQVEKLLNESRPALTSFASRFVGYDTAEDVVQEAAIKLMRVEQRRIRSGDPRPIEMSYFFRAIQTTGLDYVRQRNLRNTMPLSVETLNIPDTNFLPTESVSGIDLSCLTEQQSKVCTLFSEGYTHSEISMILGYAGPSAVSKIMERVYHRLKRNGVLMRSRKYQAVVHTRYDDEYEASSPTLLVDTQFITSMIIRYYHEDQAWLNEMIDAARYVLEKNKVKRCTK